MSILSRHFLRQFLVLFGTALLLLLLAVTVVDTLLRLDDLVEHPDGLRGALLSVALFVPSEYLAYLIPMAAFVGAFVALGLAARRAEVIAMKAGGISPLRPAGAVLLAAATISFAALLLNETLLIRVNRMLQRHERGDSAEVAFRHGSFWYHRGRFLYNVQGDDPETRSLRGVAVFELDDRGRLIRITEADRAEIEESGDWLLFAVTLREFDPERPTQPSTWEKRDEARLALSAEPDQTLFQAKVADLSIRDLREYLESRPPNGVGVVRARALLHERLSDPFTAFVFALLAVPLGLRVEQTRSLARPALHGVVLLFLFYLARQYGATFARQGLTSPAVTAWATLAAFTGLGVWRLLRVPR